MIYKILLNFFTYKYNKNKEEENLAIHVENIIKVLRRGDFQTIYIYIYIGVDYNTLLLLIINLS